MRLVNGAKGTVPFYNGDLASGRKRKRRAAPAPQPSGRPARSAATSIAAGVLLLVIGTGGWLWWRRANAFVLEQNGEQNVLLVTIDTLRADALSAYGGSARTPNLDRLAERGARFTFAHAHAVVTLPSHTSILSGQLPYAHGMRDNSGFRVKPGTATLATRLKPLGFATGAFVGGFPVSRRFGLDPGFDQYDDQMPETKGAIEISMPERPASEVVGRAADWIGAQQARFFAWVHVFDPHSPYRPPQEFASQYASQSYHGEVAAVDRALGSLFDRLTAGSRPTLVIVTADHGESLGEHGELTHGMFAYEATLRVPLIVAVIRPGQDAPTHGRVIDTPVRHIDIAPTVLDAIGISPDTSLPGSSLRDLIRTGGGADRPSYFESMTYNLVRGWAPLRGVLSGQRKYIDLPLPELYDLAGDPGEQRNLAATERDRVQLMANLLRTYDLAPPQRPGQEPAETAAVLRSLGYISGSAKPKTIYTDADDPKQLVEVDRDLHKATEHFQNGRADEAVALLKSVISRRADTADAYISLAHAYWEAGDPRQAIATLEQGLKNGAPDRDIRIRLGLYLAESHIDSGRAIKLLEGMPPTDVEALNGLGVAYGDAGRHAEAMQTFKRVLALDPGNGLAYQNLASIALKEALASSGRARSEQLLDAEQFARQAIRADPALADAHTTLGVILSSSGRKSDAIESWKLAVVLDRSQFNAIYNLWFELAAAGRDDEAKVYGAQFVERAPPAFFGPDIERVGKYLSK
jgi:arylsulfatase A-like enzyme/Flp pilus assembly protein TadD